jgi:hypothetical protein
MKLFAKLSAIGAVLVLGTAFAVADDVTFGSYGTLNGQDGVAPVLGPNQNGPVTAFPPPGMPAGPSYNISSGPSDVWAPAGPHSSWVSYNPQTGPTGNFTAPNGTYVYTTTFTVPSAGLYSGFLTVLADDTTSVFLDGALVISPGTIGSNAHCADGVPNCLFSATTGFSYELLSGTHIWEFYVQQTGLVYTGLDFYGGLTNVTPVPAPEPGTLMLLGTGLIGSAGAFLRRMRA